MPEGDPKVGEYNGFPIYLQRSTRQFYAELKDGGKLTAGDYAALCESLKRRVAVDAKAERRKLELRVIGKDDGMLRVITGLSAKDHSLLVKPRPEDDPSPYYVALPWVERLIARRLALAEQIDVIDAALREVHVPSRGYGRIENPEEMDRLLTALEAQYNEGAAEPEPPNLEKLLK